MVTRMSNRHIPPWALRACRLRRRDGEHGPFLSGKWGGFRALVFPNPDKRTPDDADFVLCFAPLERERAARLAFNQFSERAFDAFLKDCEEIDE